MTDVKQSATLMDVALLVNLVSAGPSRLKDVVSVRICDISPCDKLRCFTDDRNLLLAHITI